MSKNSKTSLQKKMKLAAQATISAKTVRSVSDSDYVDMPARLISKRELSAQFSMKLTFSLRYGSLELWIQIPTPIAKIEI